MCRSGVFSTKVLSNANSNLKYYARIRLIKMTQLWQKLVSLPAAEILMPFGIAALVTILCLVLWKLLYKWLARRAKKTKSELTDGVVRSTKGATLPWCFIAGIYAGISVSQLPEVWVAVVEGEGDKRGGVDPETSPVTCLYGTSHFGVDK